MRSNSANSGAASEDPSRPRVVSEADLRAAMALRIGSDRAAIWFGDDVRLRVEADTLRVVVPSAFFREWIQAHFLQDLTDSAAALAGRALKVAIQVASERDEGAGDVVVRPEAPQIKPVQGQRPEAGDATRRPGALPRRAARRLEEFVAGAGNQLAHSAAVEMAQSLGAAFNPLVIHGGIGLGKSHLLEGLATAITARRPGWSIAHMTAEAFTNRFLEAMRSGTLAAFRARMRNSDALLIDDIQFLAAKRATQLEFLHTFNALAAANRPIAVTAESHPAAIARLAPELATRFASGMVVKIDPPDLATRCAIVRAKSRARGIELPDDVVEFVASQVRSSVRELEGALQSLLATATLMGARIDIALARQTLREIIRTTRQALALDDVDRAVARHFQVEPADLKSPSRRRDIALARALAMFLARKHLNATYQRIGAHFGGRDHATVIAAEKAVRARLAENPPIAIGGVEESLADVVAALERALGV